MCDQFCQGLLQSLRLGHFFVTAAPCAWRSGITASIRISKARGGNCLRIRLPPHPLLRRLAAPKRPRMASTGIKVPRLELGSGKSGEPSSGADGSSRTSGSARSRLLAITERVLSKSNAENITPRLSSRIGPGTSRLSVRSKVPGADDPPPTSRREGNSSRRKTGGRGVGGCWWFKAGASAPADPSAGYPIFVDPFFLLMSQRTVPPRKEAP